MIYLLTLAVAALFYALGDYLGVAKALRVVRRYEAGRRATVHERIQPTYQAIMAAMTELDILEQALRHFCIKEKTHEELRVEMKECGCDACKFMLAYEEQAEKHRLQDRSVN